MKISERYYPALIIAGALLLYLPRLGSVNLFDWDEINFAEAAREMIATGDYLTVRINYLPFWEKPPLFIWMQVFSMKIFGITAFAARFPNAIGGVVTLLVLFYAGKRVSGLRLAGWWVAFYGLSILPFFYFKSGIIDPWFNLFIFLAVFKLWRYVSERLWRHVVLSAVFAGLAVLTKGPVALLIIGLTALVWMIVTRRWQVFLAPRFLPVYIFVTAITGGSWFLMQILGGRGYLVGDFIRYQLRLFTQEDAGHGGFLFYHFVVLFFGVFPASVVALPAFRKFAVMDDRTTSFRQWMLILFWVVLILFTVVNTKIIHYSSMCYFSLTFLAALTAKHYMETKDNLPRWNRGLILGLAVFTGLIPVLLQLFVRYKDVILSRGWIRDPFAAGNLQAEVHWSEWEFLTGVVLIAGVIFALLYFRNQPGKQLAGVLVATMLFVSSTLVVIVPRVEQYSQHAAIEFYHSLAGEKVYVDTWGFKSYAQYFYAAKPPPVAGEAAGYDDLFTKSVDRPVYIVTKNTRAAEFEKYYPAFRRIGEKNGFVFFRKDPGGGTKNENHDR
ncbi:MAG: glycosyltransferase family 39 protein [Chlorobi bacterium]|nr:glycosyltransferase family 39 protein [Chlorobiota bacterium]